MAYPGSPWGTWFKGRDPNPPVEPAVLLMGCRPWTPALERANNAACPVCGGGVRREHEGYCCLASLHVDAGTEETLGFAMQDTDAATREARAAARAEHVAGLVKLADSLARKWKRERDELWKSRQRAWATARVSSSSRATSGTPSIRA